jgi:hypothetical protein
MAPPDKKQNLRTNSRAPSGEAKTQTKPEAEGQVLPVVNPLDLWYLCEKASYAKKYPYRRANDGRPMYQRVVAQHIRWDNKFFKYNFPYCAEVGYDMTTTPPSPLMSRNDPRRPTTFPLSYYELIRNKFLPNAVTVRVSTDLLSKDELEQLIALPLPDEKRGIYVDKQGNTRGLLRIPDVVRLRKFTDPGTAQYSQPNLVSVIEMKFPGDSLNKKQQKAYIAIAGSFQRFRLLRTERCEGPKKEQQKREWMKAAQNEPVYRPVSSAIAQALLRAGKTPYALLVEDIDAEQREVRRQLEVTPIPPGTPIMVEGPSAEERNRRAEALSRTRAGIELAVGSSFFIPAFGTLAVGGGVAAGGSVAASAVATNTARTVVADAGGTLIRHWRYALPVVAANAAIYEAAAEGLPPPDVDSKLTPDERKRWEDYQSWAWGPDATKSTEIVRYYLFWMDAPRKR